LRPIWPKTQQPACGSSAPTLMGTVPAAVDAGFSSINWDLSSDGAAGQGDEGEPAPPPAGTPAKTMMARCHFMRRASGPGTEPGVDQDMISGYEFRHKEPIVWDRPDSTSAESPPASTAGGGQRRRQRGGGGLVVEVPGTPRQDAPLEDRPSSTPAKATTATCHFLRKALLGAKGGQQREDGCKAGFMGMEAESDSRDRPASSPAKAKFATCHFMRKALMGTKTGQQHGSAPAVEFMGIERQLAPEHTDTGSELEEQPVSTSPKTPPTTCYFRRKSMLSPKSGRRHDDGPPAEPVVAAEWGLPAEERRPRPESTPRGRHLGLASRPKAVHPSPDPVEASLKEQLFGMASSGGARARYALAAVPDGRSASAGQTEGSAPVELPESFAHPPLLEHGTRSASAPLCQPRRGPKKGQLPKDLRHEQLSSMQNPVLKAFSDPMPHIEQEIKVVPRVVHTRLPETGMELKPAKKLAPPLCAQAPAPPSRYISAGSVPFCRRRHSALTAIKC